MAHGQSVKVLHLVKTAVGATWALRQMRELVQLGIEVHVAMPAGKLVPSYEAAGVKVHLLELDFSVKHPVKTIQNGRNLRELVKTIRPDLIHSHFVSTTLTMRFALRDMAIPRIFQVPGPLHLEHFFFKNAEIRSSTAADYWIGSCKWTQATYLQAGIPADHVFLSFYGTDLPSEVPQGGKLRSELGLDNKSLIVGMVAYMYAPKAYLGQKRGLKGHEDLIDALAICRKKGLPVIGVFVGGAWENAAWYEDQVKAYGLELLGDAAIFLGTRSDVFDLYSSFELAVHPSHSENLGGAVESLAMAVPTIASATGGFPDIVIPMKTGWLVSPKNPQALAEMIETVISDLEKAKQIAQVGRDFVLEELNVKKTAQEVADIYQRILGI